MNEVSSVRIALVGPPNVGKTTLFNSLCGTRQRVGNYPGVTVERTEGEIFRDGIRFRITDLPGTYSLTAHAPDERITLSVLLKERPDLIVNVVDMSHLERSLYLSTQLFDLGIPLVLAFNMHDVARAQGIAVDTAHLSRLFGCPIVCTTASRKEGLTELIDALRALARDPGCAVPTRVDYGAEIMAELSALEPLVALLGERGCPARWGALQALESAAGLPFFLDGAAPPEALVKQATQSRERLIRLFGDTPETLIAERRYGFISGACMEAVKRTEHQRHELSDAVDAFVLNQAVGLPLFLGIMWLVFKLTFFLSGPLMGLIERAQGWLTGIVAAQVHAPVLRSLLVDGVIDGAGSVLVFVPAIFCLFVGLGFLEDSGYMARAAFLMDRIMHTIGLHGRSFVPMILGFGCSVPAIMAARTIGDRRDRLVTILVTPFMSCSARLPVYTLLIGTFFSPERAGTVLFSLYVIGIVVALIVAKVLRATVFRGEAETFVMELPPYRMPTVEGLFLHTWQRIKGYLKKAGSIILLGGVAIWALCNLPVQRAAHTDYAALIAAAPDAATVTLLERERAAEWAQTSYAGRFGTAITPLLKPLGFDDWRLAVALTGGLVAKEVVVSTLGTLYGVEEGEDAPDVLRRRLRGAIRADGRRLFTPVVAYAFLIFVLLYVPCLATVAVIRQESGSWGWALFSVGYSTAIAWGGAFIVYQGGRLLGL